MSKVLVTGATGFVGSWLTQKLLHLGRDVRVISRSGKFHTDGDSSKLEIFKGDVTQPASLLEATKNIHTIFHLAGVVGYSRAMREQMYQTNVMGTQNVLDAYKASGCRRLVYMSSVVAVGSSFDGKQLLNESSEYNLADLDLGYFETKREAEQLVHQAARSGDVDAVILNPSTIYGPGDATKGSRSTQIKVARGQFPFYTSGGVNVIHIDDVVDAVMRAWEVGRTGERYILSGENLLIRDLFKMIAQEAGVRAPFIYLPNRLVLALGQFGNFLESHGKKGPINSENAWASILFHWYDNLKARKELSLNPRPAQMAISESVRWMKNHGVI